jgi:NADPH-dependent curcumin reductase CurA
MNDWNRQFAEYLEEGGFTYPHTAIEGGVAELPASFIGLLKGKYSGTAVARLCVHE